VLTPFDDYPIHQTPLPIAHPATGDPNQYDRYFFNGYEADGQFFIGGAMGHYPNRHVIDAAFSVVHDGIERSVFASGRIPLDRTQTAVGPVRIEVVEPLRVIRMIVEPGDHGIEADVTFRARTQAIEEPRQTITRGTQLVMDYTRLTQWGSWEGSIRLDGGTELTVDPTRTFGTRDRSWGVRGVGQQLTDGNPHGPTQIFWLWAPLNFDDVCTHLALFERADGERWLWSGGTLPVLTSPDAPVFGDEHVLEEAEAVDYDITWMPGRREMQSATLTMTTKAGEEQRIEFERLFTFRMRGIGYSHPQWGHGWWRGELAVGHEAVKLDEFDPEDPTCIHIQTLCKVRMGDRTGVGVLEQLAFGDHEPSGLRGFTTGFGK
jgi:hypothetical protein